VSDRGCGIPAEIVADLFKPFFSTKAQGMGLGLSICRSIIEYHQGQLSGASNPEGGSTFQFALPVNVSP
jgi:two-component system sensor histidine kinase DctS